MGRCISVLSDQNKWISASLQKNYKLSEYPPHPAIQFGPVDTGRKLNIHEIFWTSYVRSVYVLCPGGSYELALDELSNKGGLNISLN